MSAAIEAFHREMESQGLACSEPIIADGRYHHFRLGDDKPSRKSGSYCAFDDGFPLIMFHDWRADEKFTWSAKKSESLSPEERQRHKEQISKAKEATVSRQRHR